MLFYPLSALRICYPAASLQKRGRCLTIREDVIWCFVPFQMATLKRWRDCSAVNDHKCSIIFQTFLFLVSFPTEKSAKCRIFSVSTLFAASSQQHLTYSSVDEGATCPSRWAAAGELDVGHLRVAAVAGDSGRIDPWGSLPWKYEPNDSMSPSFSWNESTCAPRDRRECNDLLCACDLKIEKL